MRWGRVSRLIPTYMPAGWMNGWMLTCEIVNKKQLGKEVFADQASGDEI